MLSDESPPLEAGVIANTIALLDPTAMGSSAKVVYMLVCCTIALCFDFRNITRLSIF